MKDVIIQLAAAFAGALGFSILYRLRFRHVLFASFAGMVTWGVYLAVHSLTDGSFIPCLAGALFAAILSEILAHLRKCPATLFLLPAIIPLVPGGTLYYTMSSAVRGDFAAAAGYGRETVICACAIAAGISFATVLRELHTPKKIS